MPVVHSADAVVHELNGNRFSSYAAPARGSSQLCAWRLEVPPGPAGLPHRVSHEEVFYVLSGALQVMLDGRPAEPAGPGDAIVVAPGTLLRVDNPGPGTAVAWVTTSVGLQAELPDGSRISPPWVQ
jgi:mannose-6-phosphate isomerase-like protein (cupin superfamily)